MKVECRCESCNKTWSEEMSAEEYRKRRPFGELGLPIAILSCADCKQKEKKEQTVYNKYEENGE